MVLASMRIDRKGAWIWLLAIMTILSANAGSVGCAAGKSALETKARESYLPAAAQSGAEKPGNLYLGGDPAAPIKIEVFSDYQCPVCRAFYLETLKPLLADYGSSKKIYIVYHDMPLDMHLYARKAARYALAANRIGRERWLRVTDALYMHQAQWSQDGNIDAVLAKVLDPTELARIRRLAADPATDAIVEQELMVARSRNITVTPTFFITTDTGRHERVNQGIPYPVLKDFLERLIKK